MANFYAMKMICGKNGEQSSYAIKRFIDQCGVIGIGAPEETTGAGTFQNNIQIGDIIVLRKPQALLKVLSAPLPYQGDGRFPDFDWLCIVRQVEVLSWRDEDVSKYDNIPYFDARGYLQTCAAVDKKEKQNIVIDWLNIIQGTKMKQDLSELLKDSKNLILTGAPGTGKTYLAKEVAYFLTGDTPENHPHVEFVQFHPSYDYTDFVEGLRPTKPGDDGNIGFVRQDGIFKVFCQRAIESTINAKTDDFEEAWQKLVDWLEENDFAEVKSLNGKVTFEVELNEYGNGLASRTYASEEDKQKHIITPGRSKYFNKEQLYRVYRGLSGVPNGGHDNYRKAVVNMMKEKFDLSEYNPGSEENDISKPKYVFIIDEINRGDIAKIFGELFFAIDPGYRGIKGRVKTQYSNLIEEDDVFKNGFYVPDNVYIIGTMNDIDRNVESMDFAIRRRFTWKEIKPEDNTGMWDGNEGIEQWKPQAGGVMKAINEAITKTDGLGAQYQLGASYFLKLNEYNGDFKKLWDCHIAILLKEYLRGMPKAEDDFNNLKSVWDRNVPTTDNAIGNTSSPTDETQPVATE